MKKLKNWFVSFDTIKGGATGLINSVDYIFDDNHDNHKKDGHEIVAYDGIKNSHKVLKNILQIQQSKDIEVKLARKGGRTASYGKNLLVSFPPEIKLTDSEYKQISNKLIYELINFISVNNDLKYTDEQIKYIQRNFILSSLHRQDKTRNDHLNFVIGNVFLDLNNDKKLKRVDLGKKMYSQFLKNMTNKVLLNYGQNYLDYQIKSQRKARNRKNKLPHTINKLNEVIDDSLQEMKQLQQLFKEMEFLQEYSQKLKKRIDNYLNRMATALEEDDTEKFNKNQLLVEKSYNKLESLVSEEHKEKLSKFEELKKSLELKRKSQSTLYPAPTKD
ncbi:hypothetical protein N9A28_02575 [Sulfurimonas sp.]|nr:hypothetical protein [Sulfurimonas sp.]